MVSEKIQLILVKRGMTKLALANKINWGSSKMYNRLKKDDFTESELKEIADVLDCTLEINFTLNDTNEVF